MPSWVTDLGGLWAAIAAGVLLIVGAVLARRWQKRHPATPTWPEIWKRIEAQDAKIAAQGERIEEFKTQLEEEREERQKERRIVGGILTKLLEQFPQGSLPQFDDDEFAYLRSTIPGPLFRKLKRA